MTEEEKWISPLKTPNLDKKTKVVTTIGGDGIGPLVVDGTVLVLEGMKIPGLEIRKMPAGESAIETHGAAFPPETRESIDNCDAILFGATEEKALQVIAYLRWGLGNYANIRPIKYFPGMATVMKTELVENVDYCFVREGTEGMYAAAGKEGKVRQLARKRVVTPADVEKWGEKAVYAMRIVSPKGTDRIGRVACEICQKRKEQGVGKGLVEIVCKPNVLRIQDRMFIKRITKIAEEEFPDLKVEWWIVDDFARRLLRYPNYHDTIVIPNMLGDILSDEAAEIVGGLGVAGSGVYGPKTSYFEPTHGSAPLVLARKNYKGEPVANPTATILSAVLMLDYLGYEKESEKLKQAVANMIKGGLDVENNWQNLPRDAVPKTYWKDGKFGSTTEVAEKVLEEYKKL
ncbi:MAG: isocitrate/isopropylmalate dehydrogenase family protein [Candidatus Helarchaeota archaeon]|nr:isocitrate/isopropylmalate dehydrogenase family protein [Candidatus Helarchaeota archaeon]